jgi:uncharacterized membrane protein YkvA (DUF1232 family)
MQIFERLKRWAGRLESEVYALYLAYKDSRVPWYARLIAALVVGYAFSPIDLIPDPIPVLGYLDDLVLVPLGIALAIKLIPPDILAEHRAQARKVVAAGKLVNRAAAVVMIGVWISLAALAIYLMARAVGFFR